MLQPYDRHCQSTMSIDCVGRHGRLTEPQGKLGRRAAPGQDNRHVPGPVGLAPGRLRIPRRAVVHGHRHRRGLRPGGLLLGGAVTAVVCACSGRRRCPRGPFRDSSSCSTSSSMASTENTTVGPPASGRAPGTPSPPRGRCPWRTRPVIGRGAATNAAAAFRRRAVIQQEAEVGRPRGRPVGPGFDARPLAPDTAVVRWSSGSAGLPWCSASFLGWGGGSGEA